MAQQEKLPNLIDPSEASRLVQMSGLETTVLTGLCSERRNLALRRRVSPLSSEVPVQSNTALLIIGVQLGMFEESNPVYQNGELLATISDLITRARDADIPVIYVQHGGGSDHLLEPDSPGWPIHPAVVPAKGELVIHKRYPDAFQGTGLQGELGIRGIRHLIAAGIQTEYCIDTTCRRAYSLGYAVTLVQDAHSTWDTKYLKALQIVNHHNQVLGTWFATLKEAHSIKFDSKLLG